MWRLRCEPRLAASRLRSVDARGLGRSLGGGTNAQPRPEFSSGQHAIAWSDETSLPNGMLDEALIGVPFWELVEDGGDQAGRVRTLGRAELRSADDNHDEFTCEVRMRCWMGRCSCLNLEHRTVREDAAVLNTSRHQQAASSEARETEYIC